LEKKEGQQEFNTNFSIQREVYYPKTQGKQKEFHNGVPKLKTDIKKQKKALRLTESASE